MLWPACAEAKGAPNANTNPTILEIFNRSLLSDAIPYGLQRPLFIGHRSRVAIGPATFARQGDLCLDTHLMPGGGAEFNHLQPAAEQFDAIGRLRALIAAIEHPGRESVGAVMLADRDIFRPQRDANLFIQSTGMKQRYLAAAALAE